MADPSIEKLYLSMMQTISERCRHSVNMVKQDGLAHSKANDSVADALSWFVVLYFGRFAATCSGAEYDRLANAVVHICSSAIFEGNGS